MPLHIEEPGAAAVGEACGPEAGLEIVDRLTGLADYGYLHSTRAELLRRLGVCSSAARPRSAPAAGGLSERRPAELTSPPPSSNPRRTSDAPARSTAPG